LETKKKISSGVVLILVAVIVALLFTPCALAVHQAYESYVENELSLETKNFADTAEMGKQLVLSCLTRLTERVNNVGKTLSVIGTDADDIAEYFSALDFSTDTDKMLIYNSDGSLIYGEGRDAPLFLETARESESSGGNSVSELIECADGTMRLGIASSFIAKDGGTWAVVLLCSQTTLELTLEEPALNDEGRIGIIDESGSVILCRREDGSWLKNGQYELDSTNGLKDKLLTITKTDDGEVFFTAYAKPLGINNWLVIYMAPSSQVSAGIRSLMVRIYIFGGLAIILLLATVCVFVWLSEKGHRQMELFKKKFRLATKQSARAAFEYDRRTDKLVFISESEHVKLPKPYVSLMELGTYLHPADRPTYYQSVADLRSIGTTSVIVRLVGFCGRDVYRWYHVTATRLTDKGEGRALTIGTVEDIDEQENERIVLHEKATTDGLTGLWNRAETERAVNERLTRLGENEHSVFALLDLDGFKEINDTYGHDCGDRALIHFANKLRSTFRFGDILGRLGGDEFVVYMTLTAEREIVERRLKELMENLAKDSTVGEDNIPPVTCSIGCCIASRDDTFESVYKSADEALYESKTRGKMQFTIVG